MSVARHLFVTMGICAVVAFGACGGSDTNGGGGGGGGGDASPECTRDSDCEPGKVCAPSSQTCVVDGAPCTGHAECIDGTYCEPSLGACQPGSTGKPCAGPENCSGGECLGGFCGCTGVAHERQLEGGPLDVYLVLDRTGSMGRDCDYTPGTAPPESSKACYATYALSDYLTGVAPIVDTRLAFHFMSQPDDCDGSPYLTPLIPLTTLPIASDHSLIQTISDETFAGGLGTHIEGALRGIAGYTASNRTQGREMIGVLITDGDPQGCEQGISTLAQIIADHHTNTGIRTFIIGMEGATEDNLEQLAIAGGAKPHDDYCGSLTPPCHYWNVGDGSGDVLASALQAIVDQAAPLPCQLDVTGLTPPEGEMLDYGKINVALSQDGTVTTIGQVPDAASCPAGTPAWYYDDPSAPTTIQLCENACTLVSGAGDGARLDVVVGCTVTIIIE
ncbi:MAG TPA: vWA domain-containing protein [Haliangium sp.]|nr:vWA domain-containing protein [Haliangium sp.]